MPSPEALLQEQYEQNVELAHQLGVYDPATYPTHLPQEIVLPKIEQGAALVIAKTVQGIGLIGEVHGDLSLTTRFNNLGKNNDSAFAGCSTREWGGLNYVKTQRFSDVHDRGVRTPFHVTLVKDGLSEDENGLSPLLTTESLLRHEDIAAAFMDPHDNESHEVTPGNTTITISQYLTLSALRSARNLPHLTGVSRLLHYPTLGTDYTKRIPTVSNSGKVVNLDEGSEIRSEYVGIRTVRDVPYN